MSITRPAKGPRKVTIQTNDRIPDFITFVARDWTYLEVRVITFYLGDRDTGPTKVFNLDNVKVIDFEPFETD